MAYNVTIEQRRRILFTAVRNFAVFERELPNSPFLIEPPDSSPTFAGKIGMWDGVCLFKSRSVRYKLTFSEAYRKQSNTDIQRRFSYDFRQQDCATEIFRFDNHGNPLAHTSSCHIHCGQGKDVRHYENDPFLKGFSMSSITLYDALEIINTYLEEGVLPWS